MERTHTLRKGNSDLLQNLTPHNKPILFIQFSHVHGPTCITPIPFRVLYPIYRWKTEAQSGKGLVQNHVTKCPSFKAFRC